MRVIGGIAKGHQLRAPRSVATRPTGDKVREAIFDMLDAMLAAPSESRGRPVEWSQLRVLDLYAGSGALGIEALSRGAIRADFVEVNPAACQTIRENLARTKLDSGGRVYCVSADQFVRRMRRARYDLVLMDPPYAEAGLQDVLANLGARNLIRDLGWLVVEHAHRRPLPERLPGLTAVKNRRHGDTDVTIYVNFGGTQTPVERAAEERGDAN